MIIDYELTIQGPEGALVKVTVSHNDKPGCKVEAQEVWEEILAALVVKNDRITVVR